jgi:hypothetical protein
MKESTLIRLLTSRLIEKGIILFDSYFRKDSLGLECIGIQKFYKFEHGLIKRNDARILSIIR